MREILFKAKRINNGEWEIGCLIILPNGDCEIGNRCVNPPDSDPIWEKSIITHKVDPSTICQYTGLTDKKGNKIWENDVVNCPLEECCGKVIWNENEALFAFAVLCEDGIFEEEYLYDFENYIEVIGNIFDNPELLRKD